MKMVDIKADLATLLRLLGQFYKSPADAIKEYISNAIDAHLEAEKRGNAVPVCNVKYTLEKDKIVIEHPYPMSARRFEEVLQKVAGSVKSILAKKLNILQIGEIGIGNFAFFNLARKCVFYCKLGKSEETLKVTIKEGMSQAGFETARKHESLKERGMKIVISEPTLDFTKSRGPLSPAILQKFFGRKFDTYLRDGRLAVKIQRGNKIYNVEAPEISLPRIAEEYNEWYVKGDSSKKMGMELYYDPSGNGKVGIRHKGVVVVDSVKDVEGYNLENSIYASGDVFGYVDADFLSITATRNQFLLNKEWEEFIVELDKLKDVVAAYVQLYKEEEAKKKLTEIQKEAIHLAKELLDSDEFLDLELLEGKGRKKKEKKLPPNGFDFVPCSLRVSPGKIGTIPLRVFVPKKLADGSRVSFSVDCSNIDVHPKKAILKEDDADQDGVVTIRVSVIGKKKTLQPSIVCATSGELKAFARVRVDEPVTRGPIKIGKDDEGEGIYYVEIPFSEEGPSKHSKYDQQTVKTNTLNPDYKLVTEKGSDEEKVAYAALMIAKETLVFNDHTGVTDDFLERLLTFNFMLKEKLPRGKKSKKK